MQSQSTQTQPKQESNKVNDMHQPNGNQNGHQTDANDKLLSPISNQNSPKYPKIANNATANTTPNTTNTTTNTTTTTTTTTTNSNRSSIDHNAGDLKVLSVQFQKQALQLQQQTRDEFHPRHDKEWQSVRIKHDVIIMKVHFTFFFSEFRIAFFFYFFFLRKKQTLNCFASKGLVKSMRLQKRSK